jgi:NAD(P)-dependent dehydrogenase (short-subunit alcohol dehydrogenase family)
VSSTTAVVIGAGGGIGHALVEEIASSRRYTQIHALSRSPRTEDARAFGGFVDVTDEASVSRAAETIGGPIDLLIIATGMLHEGDYTPEKSLRNLSGAAMARVFAVNTIGPALVLKHFASLLAKDRRAIIAVLSARVGSISDNRTGGWYSYRASKAALNMVVRSAAIEIGRSRPEAICVALHPGTVDTALSGPFQRGLSPGNLFTPARAARQLLDVIDGLNPSESGGMFAWDGNRIDY